MFGLSVGEAVLVIVVGAAMALAIVFPASIICRKLGFSPWLGVLSVVPVANVLLLWYVAFASAATTGRREATV